MKNLEREIKSVKKKIDKISKLSPESRKSLEKLKSPLNKIERKVTAQHILEKIDSIDMGLQNALDYKPKRK